MTEAKEILKRMLQVVEEKTQMRMEDSSDLAVRLYAAAAELESLYAYCDWALRQNFPQTATGAYLDKHAQMRFLSRKEAEKAKGNLTFYLSEAQNKMVCIPAGTVVTDASLIRFVTLKEGHILPGDLSCTVQAQAEEAGVHGNVAEGTITQMPQAPMAVTACKNAAPFTGGAAGESDEALRERILESYRRLPNGANAAFYESRIMEHKDVSGVKVLPRNRGVGTVDIVVASREGAPTQVLLNELKQDLDQYRELAVDLQVLPPTEIPVAVHAALWPKDGVVYEEAAAAVEAALRDFFDGKRLGKNVYLAELGHCIFSTGMVKNYVLTAPTEDTLCTEIQLPYLAELVLTEGE